MKLPYLFCLAGCLGSTTASPPLKGSFYTISKERGFSSNLFQFTGNRFRYYQFGCTGSVEGQGTFVVKADRLLLYCEHVAADTAVTTTLSTDTAAVPTFRFRVVDTASGDLLPGVTIASQKKDIGVSTNAEGEASLTYFPPAEDKLLVSFVGYNRVSIPVQATTGQRFTVRLGPPYYFGAGDTLVFQLKDVRPNAFAYRPFFDLPDSTDEKAPYSHCEKINQAVVRKLIQPQ